MASTIILSDNGASSGSAGLKQTAGNDGVLILQTTTSGGTATNAIYVDTSQNVGIGTSSPSTKLHVEGTNVISTVKASSGYAAQILNAATSNVSLVAFQANSVDQARIIGDTSTLQFCTGSSNTERARILSTGGVQFNYGISVGGTAPATEGSGVKFPATQVASSDANTLDDYEEGTWTPGWYVVGGTINTPAYANGTYTKIGNTVYIRGYISYGGTVTGSPSGGLGITGLPFTPGNGFGQSSTFSGGVSVIAASFWLSNPPSFAQISSGATSFFISYRTSTGGASTAYTDMDRGATNYSQFSFQGQYTV